MKSHCSARSQHANVLLALDSPEAALCSRPNGPSFYKAVEETQSDMAQLSCEAIPNGKAAIASGTVPQAQSEGATDSPHRDIEEWPEERRILGRSEGSHGEAAKQRANEGNLEMVGKLSLHVVPQHSECNLLSRV